jgi:hypothetical protein
LKEHLAKVRPSFRSARTFQRTSYLPGEISQIDWWHTGCFERPGGAPEKVVCDNEASIVRERRGGRAILHDEVAAFFGAAGDQGDRAAPGRSPGKGQIERTNGYLDRSFLLGGLRRHRGPAVQPRPLGPDIAYRRYHRRVGGASVWLRQYPDRSRGRVRLRSAEPHRVQGAQRLSPGPGRGRSSRHDLSLWTHAPRHDSLFGR